MTNSGIYFSISFCVLVSWPSNKAIVINNYDININESYLNTISHHFCDRLIGTHLILLTEKSASLFYKVLLRSFQSTFYVHNTLIGQFSPSDYYIIYIEDEQFFFEESNYDYRFWNTTKTYLIVSENKLKTKIILPHIQRLWKTFKVFKISLLHLDNLKVLRIFDDGFYKYVSSDRKLNYGINNVKKYPLRAVIFERMPSIIFKDGVWIGPDWETLQMFSKLMNFSLEINMFSDNSGFGSFTNGSYTGVLAEVVYGRADVSFNGRFLNDPMIDKAYRYTRNNGLDFICFIVPIADSLSKFQMLWKTFTFGVWLSVVVTYASMTKSFQYFNKSNNFGSRKFSDPFMTSLKVILGMSVCDSLPKHVAGRLLLVSCSAACFVIVTLFQASMVTKLSIEFRQNEIDTFEELDQSGMEIRTSLQDVRDSLAMYSYTKSLADKINLEKDRQDYATSKFVFTARIMNLSIRKFSNYVGHIQNASFELHIVSECPLLYYLTYAVALDFPFLFELNDLLTRLEESGISNKWKHEIQKFEKEYYKPVASNKSNELKAYSMNDLWFAFVLLFVGYAISLVVLMFEFIFKKYKNRITFFLKNIQSQLFFMEKLN